MTESETGGPELYFPALGGVYEKLTPYTWPLVRVTVMAMTGISSRSFSSFRRFSNSSPEMKESWISIMIRSGWCWRAKGTVLSASVVRRV